MIWKLKRAVAVALLVTSFGITSRAGEMDLMTLSQSEQDALANRLLQCEATEKKYAVRKEAHLDCMYGQPPMPFWKENVVLIPVIVIAVSLAYVAGSEVERRRK